MTEINLRREDRRQLLTALSEAFHAAESVNAVLDDVGFPRVHYPDAAARNEDAWRHVLGELEQGVMHDGMQTLLTIVLGRYPANPVFANIAGEYLPRQDASDAAGNGTANEPGCRLFVRVTTEDDRRKVLELLASLGFGPAEDYSTTYVTRYSLVTRDTEAVRRALEGRELYWTLVPPGSPDYLLSHLMVQGPDGRNFRFADTPAATTVADIAADTLSHYPDDAGSRLTVTDRVAPDGQGVRLAPDATLADAEIRDGDRLRVGYQTNAGSVSPAYRDPLVRRAGNQIRDFVAAREGIGLAANSPDLATVFELDFVRRSFGPPPAGRDQPTEICDHVVQIDLGDGFPLAAPTVFWLTEIFHPNIWPNYDSDAARQHQAYQGLVCLGELAEAWQPAMDLGRLCQMLIDMAAYRNYSIRVPTGRVVVADGRVAEETRDNVYNKEAAKWASRNQDAIADMGGIPDRPVAAPTARGYRGIVEPAAP